MPMDTVFRVLSSCMVHKILTIEEPQYLRERLLYRDQVSQRASRHGGNLHLPRVNLELGRRSFSYFGPKVYNDLPDSLEDAVEMEPMPLCSHHDAAIDTCLMQTSDGKRNYEHLLMDLDEGNMTEDPDLVLSSEYSDSSEYHQSEIKGRPTRPLTLQASRAGIPAN
ncbi:hypothetical protein J6590_041047 [Homalodisca vitripennis]|nr:hypothetical protein J6590_041047 [Homalodisca vitripennis]